MKGGQNKFMHYLYLILKYCGEIIFLSCLVTYNLFTGSEKLIFYVCFLVSIATSFLLFYFIFAVYCQIFL